MISFESVEWFCKEIGLVVCIGSVVVCFVEIGCMVFNVDMFEFVIVIYKWLGIRKLCFLLVWEGCVNWLLEFV